MADWPRFTLLAGTPQRLTLLSLQLAFVIILAGIFCYFNISHTSVTNVDEALHISATQEMQITGNYFRPTIEGTPYYNKPPLKLWLSLIPFKYVTDLNLSFRFLDGIAGIVIALLVFYTGHTLLSSSWAGVWAVILLFGTRDFMTHHVLRSGTQDSFLVLFSMLAMLTGLQFFRELDSIAPSERRVTKLAWLLGAIVGLAALVKTVAAFVTPTALVAFGLLSNHRRQALWRFREPVIASVLLSLILPALYVVPHCLIDPAAFPVFFTHELVDRAVHGYHNSDNPFYYLHRFAVRNALVASIPVTVGALLILLRLLPQRSANNLDSSTQQKASLLFLLCWAVVPFLILTALRSRLPWYPAPIMPALALIGAWAIVTTWRTARNWFAFNTVPDQLRRFIPAESYFRTTVWGFICSLILSLMVTQSMFAIYRIGVHITNKPERSPLDLLSHQFRKGLSRSAVALDMPKISILERPYLNGLKPVFVNPGESSPLAAISAALPNAADGLKNVLIVTNASMALALLEKSPAISGYRFFPPVNTPPQFNRPEWLAVLDTQTPPLKSLIPTKRNLVCAAPAVTPLYGFGESAKPRGSYATEIYAGVGINGDTVLKRYSSSLTLRLAKAPGVENELPLSLALNGALLGNTIVRQADVTAWEVTVPPGTFQQGTNVLSFQLQPSAVDAEKRRLLLCHSLRITPNLPLALTSDADS